VYVNYTTTPDFQCSDTLPVWPRPFNASYTPTYKEENDTFLYIEGETNAGATCDFRAFAIQNGEFGISHCLGTYVKTSNYAARGGTGGRVPTYACNCNITNDFTPFAEKLPATLNLTLFLVDSNNIATYACLQSVKSYYCGDKTSPAPQIRSFIVSLFAW